MGYLSHPDCEPTGRVFVTGLGAVSELFLGATPGWRQVGHDIEHVRDNFPAIADTQGFVVPTTGLDLTAALLSEMPALTGR